VELSAALEQIAVMANVSQTMLTDGFRRFDLHCGASIN
jgi:hypothetical protein